MAETFITLPPEGSGKKLRVNDRIVDAQTVHEQFITPTRDRDRTPVSIYAEAIAGVTAETLVSLIKNTGGSVASGATSISPTSGKTLRLTHVYMQAMATSTVLNAVRARVRINLTGAAVVTSPIYLTARLLTFTAVAANQGHSAFDADMADGIDIPSGSGVGVTHFAGATTYSLDVSMFGYEFTP